MQIQAPTAGKSFTVVGTYGYTPLEQFGGKAAPASDLYALGCTLIHLATGIAPAELPQKQGIIDFRALTNLERKFIKWIEWLSAPILDQRPSSAQIALATLKTESVSERLPTNKYFLQKVAKSISNLLIRKPNQFLFATKFGLKANKPPRGSKILFTPTSEIIKITIPPKFVFSLRDLSRFILLTFFTLVFGWLLSSILAKIITISFSEMLLLLFCLLIFYILIVFLFRALTTINLQLDSQQLRIINQIFCFNFTLLTILKEKITKLNFIVNRQEKSGAISIDCARERYILPRLERCSTQEKAWITLILSQWSNLPVTDKSK